MEFVEIGWMSKTGRRVSFWSISATAQAGYKKQCDLKGFFSSRVQRVDSHRQLIGGAGRGIPKQGDIIADKSANFSLQGCACQSHVSSSQL